MKTNLQVGFNGNCDAAFTFYETVFGTKRSITMRYGDAPPEMPSMEASKELIMHTAMQLGTITLMGSDAPPGWADRHGGFQISIDDPNEVEVKRLFAALSDGGNVVMPLAPTLWSPLFGMCADKFGVPWMVSMTGPQPVEQ